ncbi:MAG: hypothetical protein AAB425_05020, partial [Bdellovibrionota bacterium]
TVHILKSDPLAFEKLVFVMRKMTDGDQYILNLDIASFSPFPSGSCYRSESVTFSGSVRKKK